MPLESTGENDQKAAAIMPTAPRASHHHRPRSTPTNNGIRAIDTIAQKSWTSAASTSAALTVQNMHAPRMGLDIVSCHAVTAMAAAANAAVVTALPNVHLSQRRHNRDVACSSLRGLAGMPSCTLLRLPDVEAVPRFRGPIPASTHDPNVVSPARGRGVDLFRSGAG